MRAIVTWRKKELCVVLRSFIGAVGVGAGEKKSELGSRCVLKSILRAKMRVNLSSAV